eukprot:748885-Hanusia_phi.AAC.2
MIVKTTTAGFIDVAHFLTSTTTNLAQPVHHLRLDSSSSASSSGLELSGLLSLLQHRPIGERSGRQFIGYLGGTRATV